jgi:hypothetical protein
MSKQLKKTLCVGEAVTLLTLPTFLLTERKLDELKWE